MAVDQKTREAIAKKLRKEIKLMDVDEVKKEVVEWLDDIPYPEYPNKNSWAECVTTYPAKPEDKELESGIRLRISFKLYTADNEYLVSMLESLSPESRNTYFLTVHLNWKKHEKLVQEKIEMNYRGHFDDILKAKHTVWAQTFEMPEIREALGNAAKAILGLELKGDPPEITGGIPIQVPLVKTHFPPSEE